MESLVFSLNNTVPLFAVMVLGYVLKQKNFFSDAFIADANRLVFYVSLPVLLFCFCTAAGGFETDDCCQNSKKQNAGCGKRKRAPKVFFDARVDR